MLAKRLGMYHVYGPTLEMIMHTMDSGQVHPFYLLFQSGPSTTSIVNFPPPLSPIIPNSNIPIPCPESPICSTTPNSFRSLLGVSASQLADLSPWHDSIQVGQTNESSPCKSSSVDMDQSSNICLDDDEQDNKASDIISSESHAGKKRTRIMDESEAGRIMSTPSLLALTPEQSTAARKENSVLELF
ncbi:unnamed protein product [Protopolystoma xenopodis]|uniref:Uncharacterized protein n=1 Tax=Protopolystoma xenopodis TaxID=117903 RepID=A0A448WN58_9PLAT|nr:unnamed protein product [Protopolystoma xenopodis]